MKTFLAKTLARWFKFNLVGAMGMAVQLALLACFNRWMYGHYLLASVAAIELTLLHNFTWHSFYTWRDRRNSTSPAQALLQFHLSTGLVSMLGNLALMRVLVQEARLPLLVANIIAIGCCSILNFWLGDRWAFAHRRKNKAERHAEETSSAYRLFTLLVWLIVLIVCPRTHAQTSVDVLSSSQVFPAQTTATPSPALSTYHPRSNDSYSYNAGAFCGVGASTSLVATKPALGCGVGFTFIPYVFFEVGVMAPQANRSYLSGYVSVDTSIPLAHPSIKYLPFAIVGYSRLFETGHAFDYGLALALPRPGKHKPDSNSLRIELRDYWTFANPTQHNIMLRVGWMGPASD